MSPAAAKPQAPDGTAAPTAAESGAEPTFYPRIINPVRFSRAVVFAADEDVRAAAADLAAGMPWTKVETAADPQAVDAVRDGPAAVLVFDDTGLIVADLARHRAAGGDRIVVLLSTNDVIHRSPSAVARERYPYTADADLVFAVDREEFLPRAIIVPAVRAAEDLLNIRKYAKERRFIFLIVDDEPRWFSQFLPVLYGIIGQRGDVMIARTYEEALRVLFGVERESAIDKARYRAAGRGDDVVCLITDLYFPRGREMNTPVGRDLIRIVKTYYPRIPVIVASKSREAEELQDQALILPKGDPGSLQILKDYIHDFTGLGDFLIMSPDGKGSRRVRDILQLRDLLVEAGQDTKAAANLRRLLEIHAEKDAFSTWFYMHGFRRLGDILRPRQDRDYELVRELQILIQEELERINATPLSIGQERIFGLRDLRDALRRVDPSEIQPFSDNDVFSTWLDCKAYPELAEELRPIHGSGESLRNELARAVEKWIGIYREQGRLLN